MPAPMPSAKARNVTVMLWVKIAAASPVRSSAERPRLAPCGRGLLTAWYAPGTTADACAGSRTAHTKASTAGTNSSAAAIASAVRRSATRRQYPVLTNSQSRWRRGAGSYTRWRLASTSDSRCAVTGSPGYLRRAWARSAAACR